MARTRKAAPSNSWAILPAAMSLFGKNKVTIAEITKQWDEGTVVVCRKPNDQVHFIVGSSMDYADLGESKPVHHDQNPNMDFGGEFKVMNEVRFKKLDTGEFEFSWKNPDMELGKGDNLEFKACMAVFK